MDRRKDMRRWFARAPARPWAWVIGALVAAAAALGCSPNFNFRDYRSSDGFVASFPGRVVVASEPVRFDGASVPMSMSAVEVDKISFAVGVVKIEPSDEKRARQIASDVAKALAANLATSMPPSHPVSVSRTIGDSPARIADGYTFTGRANGEPIQMTAVILPTADRVYQLLVAGPSAALTSPAGKDAADTFVTSFKTD